MEIQEANKIIAEYMGEGSLINSMDFDLKARLHVGRYSKSLDALVPVWEKLGSFMIELENKSPFHEGYLFDITLRPSGTFYTRTTARTIQEAACLATAKAIQELS